MFFKVEPHAGYVLIRAEKGIFDASRSGALETIRQQYEDDNLIIDLCKCFDITPEALTAMEDMWAVHQDLDKSCIFVYHDFDILERRQDETTISLNMEDALLTLEDEEAMR